MTLFEKLQNVRAELSEQSLKMSGNNKYAGYTYFELSDFVGPLNKLMAKYKMTAIPTFTQEKATLTIIDCEDPVQTYCIESPAGGLELKGCHEIQNIGAIQTYQRRYLYQAMFDIAESDAINGTQGRPEEKPTKPKNGPVTNKTVSASKQSQTSEKPAQGANADATEQSVQDNGFEDKDFTCSACGKQMDKDLFMKTVNHYGVALCSKECKEIYLQENQ